MLKKRKALRDRVYLDYVRSFPCAWCRRGQPSEPHHFMERGGGMGMKVDDHYTVPLCRECHQQWHTEGHVGDLDRSSTVTMFYREQAILLSHWLRQRGAKDSEDLF